MDDLLGMAQKNGGRPPLSYQSFLKLAGEPSWMSSSLSMTVSSLPPVGNVANFEVSEVPTVEELGYEEAQQVRVNAFFFFFLFLIFCIV